MAKNECSNNNLWDNTGDGQYFHETDLRHEFCVGLREFWNNSPYRLKGKKSKGIILNGLFGTGSGIQIRDNTFPVYKKYSQKELIEDYAKEFNIPIVIKGSKYGLFVFATEQSARKNKHLYWI